MTDQFQPAEFDDWAASYDESVASGGGFPFEGYAAVLQFILDQAHARPGSTILDLGIGTGNLAQLFQRQGCKVWGLDFSVKMLDRAQSKLPSAILARADLREEWPIAFYRTFDCVVSTYTFHHFPLTQKVDLVRRVLSENLTPGGSLLIGDIAFQNTAAEDEVRREMGTDWEQEYFWLADETLAAFTAGGFSVQFTRISYCAGVFQFT